MKKFFAILATTLTFGSLPASAIVGGPWDGNNYNQQNTGTYQATMFMRNGLGMARFTDDTNAQFALVNQSVVFYRGFVYVGGAFGAVDWVGGHVTCTTNGDTINNFVDSGVGTNVDICNTTFFAKITEHAPIMRFAGEGQANFFGDLNQFDRETTTTTTVIEGDTETEIDTTLLETGGEFDEFSSSAGHQTKIWVHGAQISSAANTFLNPASGAGSGGVGGSLFTN